MSAAASPRARAASSIAATPGTTEKPPKPFLVGSSYERPADRDGVLYMKVNVPPNSKCVGKLQVKVGGTILP
jgi:hypothetical protein